jgi:rhamnose transport system permease protein
VLAGIWSSTLSPYFLNTTNLMNSAEFFVIFALMAFALFPIIVHGEIDLSLPSTLAVGSVLLALLSTHGVPVALGLPLVMVACALLGVVNGVLVAYAGLPSLAVTLGTMGAYRGLAFLMAGDAGVTGITDDYLLIGNSWIGIVPSTVVLALVVALLFGILLSSTPFGRYSYAIGNNTPASRMASVPVARVKVYAYALAGAVSGLAGLVWVSQYGSARGDNADGAILFVITAVVLGGVSIKGGSGRALGVLLATVLLGTIQTGMQLANVPGTSQTLVVGGLLIVAIALPRVASLLGLRLPARVAPTGGENLDAARAATSTTPPTSPPGESATGRDSIHSQKG